MQLIDIDQRFLTFFSARFWTWWMSRASTTAALRATASSLLERDVARKIFGDGSGDLPLIRHDSIGTT